ncbi:hypothetical protein M407DRAFT_131209 [Tulasnella calospora MUT 4182]|uniref:Uncharacterized protein n=1 Tax=Tulasnella calospora MUT 4182 TaxID=1051891 RepID=A0A0C3MCN5_9AGAM|nr:hypothetical protein M407DRAFT_131209 [Tulasnella calospora MUT 4182]
MEEELILATRSTTAVLDELYRAWLKAKLERQALRAHNFRPEGELTSEQQVIKSGCNSSGN